MNLQLEDYLTKNTALTRDEMQEVSNLAIGRSLHRGEFLLREGEVCRHKVFVSSGMLRTFGTSDDGTEAILQFSSENNWTLDVESYDKGMPATVAIEAIESSEVLMWKKQDFQYLLKTFPQLKIFADKLIATNVYLSRKRILTALSATPEEKYAEFVQDFPDYLSRLPLRMIAAYLGISLKTLTRIRHAQLLR